MKQREIKPCILCKEGVCHDNLITFYQVTIGHRVVDLKAVRRHVGLEMVLGGNAVVANAMGPDEDLALPIGEDHKVLICQNCMLTKSLGELLSRLEEESHGEED